VTPKRAITATAPIRICDLGGWTDTWVARRGCVLNIAVEPLVEVQLQVWPRDTSRPAVTIEAANYGMRYAPDLDAAEWGPHPLLEGALRTIRPPADVETVATVRSAAPSGASTGTSAAVLVALVGALDRLVGGRLSPAEVARTAHDIETRVLRQQSGVQDQLASAHGGINFIAITDYPRAEVQPLAVPDETRQALDRRLVLIYLGRPHHSSAVHERVIADLERRGPHWAPLEALRAAAVAGREALVAGDLVAFGKAMCDNTEAQAALRADLVHPDVRGLIALAERHAASGWKVNGAGGDGGSLTLLTADSCDSRQALLDSIARAYPLTSAIPIAVSPGGLRVAEVDLP
jgi:D-glycero-alpha-D-manno-heptose-7-phosphate kinase